MRLSLRPATPADAEAMWQYRRLEVVSRWLGSAPATLQEHRARFEDADWLSRTLVIELDGDVIGDLMIKIEDGWAQAEVADHAHGVQAELGWALSPDHMRRGYAAEALQQLFRLCFEELGLRRVTAGCFAANDASWRLMEHVGMRREAYTVRDALHRSGVWLDGLG